MGWVHARHLLELERETGLSRLAAVVDLDVPKTSRFAAEMGYTGKLFASLEEYLAWGGTKATTLPGTLVHTGRGSTNISTLV